MASHLVVLNRASKPTASVLLAHAAGFSHGALAPFAAALCASAERRGMRLEVRAFDFRGHGTRSGSRPAAEDWARWAADDVDDAIGAWADRDAAVPMLGVGHSMGASALLLAGDGPGAGAALSGAVAIEPIVGPAYALPPDPTREAGTRRYGQGLPTRTIPPNPLSEATLARQRTFSGAAEAEAYVAAHPLYRGWPDHVLRAFFEGGGLAADTGAGAGPGQVPADGAPAFVPPASRDSACRFSCDPLWEADIYRGISPLWNDVLPRESTPVALIGGGKSRIPSMGFQPEPVSLKQAMERTAHRAGAAARGSAVVPGAGHLLAMTHPEETAEAAAAALARLLE